MAREYIDWEMNRMSIPEPKVEHHEGRGKGSLTSSGRGWTARGRWIETLSASAG